MWNDHITQFTPRPEHAKSPPLTKSIKSEVPLINLGDILYGPIQPRATYEQLLKHDFLTISGNQDRQIYESTPADIQANPTMQFILEDLGHEPLEWMKSLPFDMRATPELYLPVVHLDIKK